jgi:hypothetical protein
MKKPTPKPMPGKPKTGVEAKRAAVARTKALRDTKNDLSYEDVQRLKKAGKFKGMDFSNVGVKG